MRRTLKIFVIPAGKPPGTPPEPGPEVELEARTEDGLLAAAGGPKGVTLQRCESTTTG